MDAPAPIALVTGAGRGIGRAIAERLSQAGLRVALTARSEDELAATAAGCAGPALVLPADITSAAAVDDVFAGVERAWGPAAVLVANAGAAFSARLEKTPDSEWQRLLDINLTAPFRCVRRAVPAMRAAGYGRIVVIASSAARLGEPYIAAYAASKHGVLGLVRSAAAELAGSGVTVNAVCPGYVDTPMTAATVRTIVSSTGRSSEQARQVLERKQPIGRLITPEEVADAVWFCVENGALTGQGINVDGGAVQS
jgi:3-hydroxybutyrate dehydrogenase